MKKIWILLLIVIQLLILWGIYDSTHEFNYVTDFRLPFFFYQGFDLKNPNYHEPFKASFVKADQVEIENFVGDLEIEYADVDEVIFTGEKLLFGQKKDLDILENFCIEEKRLGNKAIFSLVKPNFTNATTGFAGKVIIPKTVRNLTVNVSIGKVVSIDGECELDLKADLGEVIIKQHTGSLSIRAKLGAVKLNSIKPGERLVVRAELGDIEYAGNLADSSEFIASLGSIKLKLPPSTVTNIEADVDLGSFDCDFPVSQTKQSGLGKSVMGVLGSSEGTPTGNLKIKADLGSININKAVIW